MTVPAAIRPAAAANAACGDAMTHPLLLQARRAIESHLNGAGPRPGAAQGETLPSRGCFVSLKLAGRLRGCIGTVLPAQRTLEAEVAANAVAAATRDPRFHPLRADELPQVTLSIDLLTPPEPVESLDGLDARRYGLLVRSGQRVGVLLPDIPGVDTPQQQLEICLEKAGLTPEHPYRLERFEVERLEE